jgi:predicted TPR repeat methyltransferase
MLIDEEVISYLGGNRFSSGRCFTIPPQRRIVHRNARLLEIARGRTVLHLGCCDHTALIAGKIRRGCYLHELLYPAASRLVGVDISEEGVHTMRSLGFTDIYLPYDVPQQHYDLVIAADVIEHVPDVRAFLAETRRYDFDRLVVTTPNAYRRTNRWQLGGEVINTDHRYWFSPFTLAKVLVDAGYSVVSMEFTDAPSRLNFCRNMALRRFPLLQDGLFAIAARRAC